MGHRKGVIYEAIERFDSLMAIGESRYEAKQAIRAASEETQWTISSGRIHSHETRRGYQHLCLAFINWARSRYGINRLDQLDARADELVSQYLTERIAAGKSAYTVQTERSALRLFFGNPQLAASVNIPLRSRTNITRSRGPKEHDRHFQPAHWPEQVLFAQATGLRRAELRDLRVRDVSLNESGHLIVYVKRGKGGRARSVPVLPELEQQILAVIQNRKPEEHIFEHIPKHMDVHAYRRGYTQTFYQYQAGGRELPPQEGRLSPKHYDKAAAQRMSPALGHNRRDVVLRHYLR